MPRLNASPKEQAAARFEGLLAAGRMQQHLSVSEMCKRAGFTGRKYSYRKRDPEGYTIEEIRTLSLVVGVPVRELLAALVPSIEEK